MRGVGEAGKHGFLAPFTVPCRVRCFASSVVTLRGYTIK
jgi:hypothetical protein